MSKRTEEAINRSEGPPFGSKGLGEGKLGAPSCAAVNTNANTCKECMLRIDGKTVYACTARLHEGAIKVEPLPNKRLLRDLVTEIAPPDERLGGA